MKLPYFLCKIFHKKEWKTGGGVMDAWDYDCPICKITIKLPKNEDYKDHVVSYDYPSAFEKEETPDA